MFATFTIVVRLPDDTDLHNIENPLPYMDNDTVMFWGSEADVTPHAEELGADRALWDDVPLNCTDTDPEHIHDEGSCCECGSTEHCCGDCPAFVHPVPATSEGWVHKGPSPTDLDWDFPQGDVDFPDNEETS